MTGKPYPGHKIKNTDFGIIPRNQYFFVSDNPLFLFFSSFNHVNLHFL